MNRRQLIGAGAVACVNLGLAALAGPAHARSRRHTERILSFRHLHTDERLTLTYRIGDHYQRSALKRLNHFLRDFRTGDVMAIDPKLFDLLHDVKERLGHGDGVIEIIGGYRSPRTNAMLRRTSSGVARKSLHMTGQAVDIRLAGAATRRIRDAAVQLGRGGVGYYPKSDFVHLDTGRVRRWGA
jgi:uncharacterized protein YcbK (DUF882 family)